MTPRFFKTPSAFRKWLEAHHRIALVMILEDEPASKASVTALLSEQSLAEDWNRPEEDDAWSHLQPAQ